MDIFLTFQTDEVSILSYNDDSNSSNVYEVRRIIYLFLVECIKFLSGYFFVLLNCFSCEIIKVVQTASRILARIAIWHSLFSACILRGLIWLKKYSYGTGQILCHNDITKPKFDLSRPSSNSVEAVKNENIPFETIEFSTSSSGEPPQRQPGRRGRQHRGDLLHRAWEAPLNLKHHCVHVAIRTVATAVHIWRVARD